MMELSEAQEGVLNIAFRVADEQGLLLLDLKDLQSMLVWLPTTPRTSARPMATSRPPRSARSSGRCWCWRTRARRVSRRAGAGSEGPDRHRREGMGRINVLMSDRLMQSPRLYAMFLLWLLSELFEQLPEVGDPDKPVLVFFFDEAHLLFTDAPEGAGRQGGRRWSGCPLQGRRGLLLHARTPTTCRGDVLAQLGNRVQHALRAFTPRDAKALKQAAETFRPNPDFDTETAIREVGTGEAVVSLLEDKGVPAMVSRTLIRPPRIADGPGHRRRARRDDRRLAARGQVRHRRRPRVGAGNPRRPRRQGGQGGGDGRRDAEAGAGAARTS